MYQIKALDVYPYGAKFLFAAAPAAEDFDIELPGAFEIKSVRIINHTDTEAVRIFTVSRSEWIPSSLEGLNSKLEELRKANTVLQSRKSALAQTQKLLNEAAPPTRTNSEDIIAYIRMAQEMKLNAENELAGIDAALNENNHAIKLLYDELNERRPKNAEEAIHITGRLKSGKVIVFEALTEFASWTPKYTMDLNSKTGAIMTRLYARSSQKTGLDYTGPITFHTRIPEGDVIAPTEIKPLKAKIKPKIPEPQPERFAARSDRMMMSVSHAPRPSFDMEEDFKLDDEALAEMEAPDIRRRFRRNIDSPNTEETFTDHIVRCSGTLAGDGRESELVLGDIQLTGKIHIELIPEQRSDAWIIAEMDDTKKPLIPGEAVLSVDEQQTGSFSIPEYGLSRQGIPLGYVPGITSKKENTDSKTTSSLHKVSSNGFKITVTNDMQEDQTVVVKDRIPVSKDKNVKLEINSISPEPKERTKDNLLTWELDVKAGKTVNIVVEYTVSYPMGEEIIYI